MDEIELSKKLAMKINKINQVRGCLSIFNILKYQDDNHIFKLLLNTYFSQSMKKDYVKI